MSREIPRLIPWPMLATNSEPFDDPDYLFDIKWDGLRCLAAVDREKVRLWGREGASYSGRYPELTDGLMGLSPGTILDGELVLLRGCVPDFHALMSRHNAEPHLSSEGLEPVHYVAFDLLRLGDESVMERPLVERRELLKAHIPTSPVLSVCEGVIGKGKSAYAAAIAAGHEGIVAKQLSGTYLPNRRAWQKIKQSEKITCAVIGYKVVRGELCALLMAAAIGGELRYVGVVERNIDQHLLDTLAALRIAEPVVACPSATARWVRPELVGIVHFAGRRPGGSWRDAVFVAQG